MHKAGRAIQMRKYEIFRTTKNIQTKCRNSRLGAAAVYAFEFSFNILSAYGRATFTKLWRSGFHFACVLLSECRQLYEVAFIYAICVPNQIFRNKPRQLFIYKKVRI